MENLLFSASLKRNKEAEIKLNFEKQLEILVCCTSIFCWCRTKKNNNKKKCSKLNIYRLANLDLLNLTPLLQHKRTGLIEENVRDRDSQRVIEYFDTTFLQWCVRTLTCFLWHSSAHFFLNIYSPKGQIRSEFTSICNTYKKLLDFQNYTFQTLLFLIDYFFKNYFLGGFVSIIFADATQSSGNEATTRYKQPDHEEIAAFCSRRLWDKKIWAFWKCCYWEQQ